MNWGTGIAIVYGTFAVCMAGAAFIAITQQDPGLVQKDYYNLDLNYQAHLDKKQNTASLQKDVEARFDNASKEVALQFPIITGAIAGTVRCTPLRKDSEILSLPITVDTSGTMRFDAAPFGTGRVRLEIDWTAGERAFFTTSTLAINAH